MVRKTTKMGFGRYLHEAIMKSYIMKLWYYSRQTHPTYLDLDMTSVPIMELSQYQLLAPTIHVLDSALRPNQGILLFSADKEPDRIDPSKFCEFVDPCDLVPSAISLIRPNALEVPSDLNEN